jgi:hypothetical protein
MYPSDEEITLMPMAPAPCARCDVFSCCIARRVRPSLFGATMLIWMSQNRQSEKDCISAEHDYEVNLKAELEIILLHEKIQTTTSRLTAAPKRSAASQRRPPCARRFRPTAVSRSWRALTTESGGGQA